jgi:hypothetical protein
MDDRPFSGRLAEGAERMATYTFSSGWSNLGVRVAEETWGTVTITIEDGEVISSGDSVTMHRSGTDDETTATYVGLLEDGSAGFTYWPGQVHFELTNEVRVEGSTFPPLEDWNTELPLCFLPGTLITLPDGVRPVQELAIGDLVLTADGQAVPVKWIGRQTVHTIFGMAEGRRPVCVSAGALGNNRPARDLRLTADHALLIDGVLVHAGALVNGTTIRRMALAELGQRFTVYHIETENHEIILAEGTPAETFIDNVSRTRFDNYTEYEALYGPAPAPMAELEQPRAMSRRQVPASIHARIATAAAHILAESEQAA